MQKLSTLAAESLHSNQSVWFGYYPTSTIVSSSPGIREVMSAAVAYMCGHLNTLGGLAPVLHSQHQQGTLELELGDWMKNRRYRIFVFDHDLFSFIDLRCDKWPAILITNPKSVLVLVFSPDPIISVKVFIDGIELGEAENSSGPLYVLKWSAEAYMTGLHEIKVLVKDAAERKQTRSHLFSLEDDVFVSFSLFPSLILLTDHYIVAQVLFIVIVLGQLLNKKEAKAKRTPLEILHWSLSLCIVFFNAIVLLTLCTAIGPWFIGEIIDGHMGACFAFGVIVGGHFLDGSLTYVVGITQMAFFNIPLTAYLCWCLLCRCKGFFSHLRHTREIVCVPIHFFMFLLLVYQIYSCFFLLLTYGTLATFLSPMKLWLVVATLVLGRRVWVFNSPELRSYVIELKNCQST
ncbi:hypothetical protein AB205_0074090 [Aquarana catesbeiana]|uniref:TMEM62 C-terminal domain-containing protein n=1 Tax=Aquarana catesbeiana TaxID=8400 RepID=A0A2G9QGN0_AQUCT|nr:hypothetical protein AB205_0074090 [Aquarana catesbeiana]